MITVSLNRLEFNSFHGVSEEEQALGNQFVVDCKVKFQEDVPVINRIDQTVDYSVIFGIIERRMKKSTQLLETLCMEMGMEIKSAFNSLEYISISVEKLHPPIQGLRGSTAVNWEKQFNF